MHNLTAIKSDFNFWMAVGSWALYRHWFSSMSTDSMSCERRACGLHPFAEQEWEMTTENMAIQTFILKSLRLGQREKDRLHRCFRS